MFKEVHTKSSYAVCKAIIIVINHTNNVDRVFLFDMKGINPTKTALTLISSI